VTRSQFPAAIGRLLLLASIAASTASCATLAQVAALARVDFSLDHVSDATIAGIPLQGKSSYGNLGATDVARLLAAVTTRHVPLAMVVHVEGTNPSRNEVTARLIRMDWTLFIDKVETVSGRFDRPVEFVPGRPTDVPITVQVDLWEFFGGRAEDLFGIALGAAGVGGRTLNIELTARPTIDTPLGPMRYPNPITIVQRDVPAP
jgi:hypothetical protein